MTLIPASLRLEMNGLSHVRFIKFFGITLDDKISFSCHINNLIKSLSKIKGLLFKLS